MNEELERTLGGNSRGLAEIVFQYLSGATEEDHEELSRVNRCASWDMKRTSPEFKSTVHSRRRDRVNKPSPVSPQLTARNGQSAQLVQGTHCIRTHVNLHSDFGHPCNGTPIT
jgi:hypothetical protein